MKFNYKKSMKAMINQYKKLVLILWMGASHLYLWGQSEGKSATQQLDESAAEWLQGSYRYNTVIAVLGIIFLGIWIFLFRLNKKLNRLEQNISK